MSAWRLGLHSGIDIFFSKGFRLGFALTSPPGPDMPTWARYFSLEVMSAKSPPVPAGPPPAARSARALSALTQQILRILAAR
ncbi:hypothetical protein PtA15_12A537 [Puccinia triticina]|uniref:Uncharacterized protein n=1 Tax=Puccinia triticina TaxID=208348 RepID=A0ABY7D1H4_9BASI|nr:uncharacterized protein PtA15_12A537 [Puccinia triticina]WAQ90547.1 hypothetical protein PtA15_12A537 [Puccinia triticina]